MTTASLFNQIGRGILKLLHDLCQTQSGTLDAQIPAHRKQHSKPTSAGLVNIEDIDPVFGLQTFNGYQAYASLFNLEICAFFKMKLEMLVILKIFRSFLELTLRKKFW